MTDEEDPNVQYLWKPTTDKGAMMLFAQYAATMVVRLPDAVHDPALDPVLRDACMESFFVNVRLLAEFLVKPHKNGKDFTAWDLVDDWRELPWDEAQRLKKQWWEIASKHVVHLSKVRLESDPEFVADSTMDTLKKMRTDTMLVWNAFVAIYNGGTFSEDEWGLVVKKPKAD